MTHYLEDSVHLRLDAVLPTVQSRIMTKTQYFGVPTHKNPFDMWVYQELLQKIKPSLIIEIGTKYGGSALAFAHILDVLGSGQVVTIDKDQSRVFEQVIAHPRISIIESPALDAFTYVAERVTASDIVFIVEDSSHTYTHTLDVLRTYSPLVSIGSYFIVEDSICHHGLDVGPNPGPYEAITQFCRENTQFRSDRECESFLITWNPKGFLKRID